MSRQSNLFLVLAITTILLSSPLVSGTAFADSNDDKKKKKTFDEMCAKKKGNEPDALFCRAILGLQQSTNSFFDIFTELRLVDTNLQNQIDSFFDIFVELDNVSDQQCPPGQVAVGTNNDGSLKCADITQNQHTYISEDFICEERLIGIFSCTNYCDAGDQAINVYPNDEGMSNLNNGYSWSLLSPTGAPTTFKVLCIDWQ